MSTQKIDDTGFDFGEIVQSFKDGLKNRISSPVYGTFIILYFIFNWEFFVALFLTSEDSIKLSSNLMKHEYLAVHFFDIHNWHVWFNHLAPFLFTFIAIAVLPRLILIPAFKADNNYEFEKDKIKIENQKKIQILLAQLGQESIKTLEKKTELAEKEKEIEKIDPEVIWEKEYKNFIQNKISKDFDFITRSIYEYRGFVEYHLPHGLFKIPTQILTLSDVNGLISIDQEDQKIAFTEKGKFFAKRFLSEADKI